MESFYFWAALYFKILVISIGIEAIVAIADAALKILKKAIKNR